MNDCTKINLLCLKNLFESHSIDLDILEISLGFVQIPSEIKKM